MARVNALRAKSAENEKAKEAAKQAVAAQETLVDAVIAKADEDDNAVKEIKEVKDDTVQPKAAAVEPESVNVKQDPVLSIFASAAKNGKRTVHKNFLLSDKAASNLERAYKTLGYRSANDFMNTLLEDFPVDKL